MKEKENDAQSEATYLGYRNVAWRQINGSAWQRRLIRGSCDGEQTRCGTR